MSDNQWLIDNLRGEYPGEYTKDAAREIKKLNKRIEELEKEKRECEQMSEDIGAHPHGNCHIITTEQIRAAVEMIRALRRINTKTSRIAADALEDLLETFNIVRCEGCWECDPTIASYMNAPTCNGDGFKIGGEDE